MNDADAPFDTRQHAGRALAKSLEHERGTGSLVLAIPRGGVVVAYEVASALGLELDVIVPRKIGAPGQPELAIGALASWGDHQVILDRQTVSILGVTQDYIDLEVRQQLEEVNRRLLAYRGTTEPPVVQGRRVLLVDDGVATGNTTRAAALALRNLKASRVTLAVPVAPPESLDAIRPDVDHIVCLVKPYPFLAVGYWYRDFSQTSDAEVIELLQRARARQS